MIVLLLTDICAYGPLNLFLWFPASADSSPLHIGQIASVMIGCVRCGQVNKWETLTWRGEGE